MRILNLLPAVLSGLLPLCLSAQVRTETLLEKGWKFTRDDSGSFSEVQYDDSQWQDVTVPHDWAIYGPFSVDNDKQHTAIVQDGQSDPMEHAGRTGGLPFVGAGWYRLDFEMPALTDGRRCTLLFDGAMSHAEVFINGKEACRWPYGYNSFWFDATPYLVPGNNVLAVRLENRTESSRWYPGAGLYRNVHLIVTQDAAVPVWGTQVITEETGSNFAKVSQRTSLEFPEDKSFADYVLVTEIKDMDGNTVALAKTPGSIFDGDVFRQDFTVKEPHLWTPETPYLYTSVSKVYEGSTLKDEYTTTFGIRTAEIIHGKGFFLNGERVQFQGVCNHHDLGPLGGIANEAGIRRQIRILKDMGCNAIRTSHNMPAPELVKACDEMGMMLMAESFDEWASAKVQNGYHKLFDEWVEKDLVNLVRHFRNNPSVVMWCIGNEVPDQWNGDKGPKLTLMLQDICHREDPTRPVTNGMDAPDAVVNNNMAAVLDVPGFNYRPHRYIENYSKLPQRLILGVNDMHPDVLRSPGLLALEIYHSPRQQVRLLRKIIEAQNFLDEQAVGFRYVRICLAFGRIHESHPVLRIKLTGQRESKCPAFPLAQRHCLLKHRRRSRNACLAPVPAMFPRRFPAGLRRIVFRHRVEPVQIIVLYELYQLSRIGRISRISGPLEPVCPSLVVGGLKVEKKLVPVPVPQKVGMIPEGLLGRRIFPEALPLPVVVVKKTRPLPVMAFYAKMVVGPYGKLRLPVGRLEHPLCEGNARRNAAAVHLGHRHTGILLYIVVLRRPFGLSDKN